MHTAEIQKILNRYRKGKASSAEKELVQKWYENLVETGDFSWAQGEKEIREANMEMHMVQQIRERKKASATILKIILRRTAVAAGIIGVLLIAGYLWINNQRLQTDTEARNAKVADIAPPQLNRATVTLSDGKTIYLNNATNGQLAMQGNVKLVKLENDQIAYETTTGEVLREMKYNTVFNPKGSKVINMVLADGSHIWLNAGSSVTFPIAFTGNERRVSISGEAYFEVAHNARKPFYVTMGEVRVKVLGTHFNVTAYDDEPELKVTLLEGSVVVSKESLENATQAIQIEPGEQAFLQQMQGNPEIKVAKGVDLGAVMAWKYGRFQFAGADIQEVMRQIARWYDVEIVYEGKVPSEEFVGSTSRFDRVSALLNVLEATGKIHFRIKGKRVIVME